MINFPLKVKFTGADADQHRVPAFSGIESLDGVAKSLLIPINYLAEKRVRHKNFGFEGYSLDLVAVRPGSLDAILQIILNADNLKYAGEVGIGVTSTFLADYLRALYSRSIGKHAPRHIEKLEEEGTLDTGDMGALVDAIAPSVKRAHTVIGQGANNIVLITGDNNVVSFNRASKAYVQTSIKNNEPRSKIVSVGSYNANSRYGRVFDYEFRKTVPFEVRVEADRKTISVLMDSMTSYALSKEGDELKSAIAIKYTSIDAADESIKKMVIWKARKEINEL